MHPSSAQPSREHRDDPCRERDHVAGARTPSRGGVPSGGEPSAGEDRPPASASGGDADEVWMRRCLELAAAAAARDEVPIGAIVVLDGRIVGEGANRCEAQRDPLAHAEMEALRAAFRATGDKRLVGATLYCTLEPCTMCAGALVHARVGRLVFGARDPKFGACGSLGNVLADPRANHRCPVREGVLAGESAELLRRFFRARRGMAGGGPGSGAAR